MNNSGKTITIFLSVISILLVSITAIAVFLLIQEVESRKITEYELEEVRLVEAKLQVDFKEAQKKAFLLEEKQKESEEKIESLLEDLELEQGLREELKKENRELREAREALEKDNAAKVTVEQELRQSLSAAGEEIATLKKQIELASSQNEGLKVRHQKFEEQYRELEKQWGPFDTSFNIPEEELKEELQASLELLPADVSEIELEKIVINSITEKDGKVISVDRETNFLIVSLGKEDDVKKGAVLAIYRGERHLGDVKVSRVLSEMSAADFILPLTSQDVRKDDQAVIRQ